MKSILFALFTAVTAFNNEQQSPVTSKSVQVYDVKYSHQCPALNLLNCTDLHDTLYEQSEKLEHATLTTTVTDIQNLFDEFNQQNCDDNSFIPTIDKMLLHAELEAKVRKQ